MGCCHSTVQEDARPAQYSHPVAGKQNAPVENHTPRTQNQAHHLTTLESIPLATQAQHHASVNPAVTSSAAVNPTPATPAYNNSLTEQRPTSLGLSPGQLAHVPYSQLQPFEQIADSLPLAKLYKSYFHAPGPVPDHKNEPFVYDPLPTSTSIRLLSILPADESGLIRCNVTVVDLKQTPAPRYSCLSYTWGNPLPRGTGFPAFEEAESTQEFDQPRHPISCNGRVIHVRRNLHDALKQLPVYPDMFVQHQQLQLGVHSLAEEGRTTVLFMHLMDGAPPNMVDAHGKTPLHYAAANGHLDAVDVLLKTGADGTRADYYHKTPIDYAVERKHSNIAKLIRNFTPDQRIRMPSDNQKRQQPVPAYFWVDAICINQADSREKASQVNMIDQIFRASENTVVWLGREDKHTAMGIQTITKLYPFVGQLLASNIKPFAETSADEYRHHGMPRISMEEWDALASIYLRQWFQRMWVLQEVALSTSLVCFCGPHQVPWHLVRLTLALHEMERKVPNPSSARYVPTDQAGISIVGTFAAMLDCREKRILDQSTPQARQNSIFYRGPGKKCQPPLPRLILNFWTLQSTDPRDKVFALLGITKDDPESPNLLADYSLPVERVYADITKRMITQPLAADRPLHVLSLVTSNPKLTSLPSWVPDYSTPGAHPLPGYSFNAAGPLSDSVLWSGPDYPWNQLRLCGYRIATITGASARRNLIGRVTKFGFDPSWFELLYTLQAPYPTGQSLSEVLWRTLCVDHDATDTCPAPMHLGHQFRDFVCAQMLADADSIAFGMRESLRASGLDGASFTIESPYPSWLDDLVASEPDSFIPSLVQVREFSNRPKYRIWNPQTQVFHAPPAGQGDFMAAFGKVFGFRRLFTAGDGGAGTAIFLGMGSQNLEPGDQVWVVPGSKVPYVLRSLGEDRYRFVGDAYVHGIMQGEGVQEQQVSEIILV